MCYYQTPPFSLTPFVCILCVLVLLGHHLVREFDPSLIEEMLSYLTPSNMMVTLVAKSVEGTTTHTEKWYDPYYIFNSPPSLQVHVIMSTTSLSETPCLMHVASLHPPHLTPSSALCPLLYGCLGMARPICSHDCSLSFMIVS